ncbi:peptidase M23 [Aphanothece hegewaldii CCALA 016]|uniref:Peptidase M23 n=1 Tax=Aphanothece hegewaldii CCALA 016 TaxID=2107694 RepID=A0A2T1M0R0_9CHRO|nr:M23 family metallopeptidase [Aphanothece hegewaldii]PSF38240.1 peptidase M23 [Aphanothece hegewaldii CCALA 016]
MLYPNFIRRKLNLFRSRVPRALMLTLIISCLGGLSAEIHQKPLLAKNQSAKNAWVYAAFPVESFQAYTSGFGYRNSPVDGSWSFHAGIDIAAPLGSYVRNWWSGRVVELSDHTACGTMIKIQSEQWTHVYCHLMGTVGTSPQGRYLIDREGGIILWQGQEIVANTRIARVGMTGRTTGPHLHWGLKYGGQYIDPAPVLTEMIRQQQAYYNK